MVLLETDPMKKKENNAECCKLNLREKLEDGLGGRVYEKEKKHTQTDTDKQVLKTFRNSSFWLFLCLLLKSRRFVPRD